MAAEQNVSSIPDGAGASTPSLSLLREHGDAYPYVPRPVDRCPPGCPKCAAEYLDAKERDGL